MTLKEQISKISNRGIFLLMAILIIISVSINTIIYEKSLVKVVDEKNKQIEAVENMCFEEIDRVNDFNGTFGYKTLDVDDLNSSKTLAHLCRNEDYGFVGCTITCVNRGTQSYIYECYSDILVEKEPGAAQYKYFVVYIYSTVGDKILSDRWYTINEKEEESGAWIIDTTNWTNPNILPENQSNLGETKI